MEIKPYNKKTYRLLWIGVSIFMMIIVGIWLFSLRSQIDKLQTNQVSEKKLFENSKAEWQRLFSKPTTSPAFVNTPTTTIDTPSSSTTINTSTEMVTQTKQLIAE